MLRGISPLISPELIKVLMEMGHGDEIVFADANFPAVSHAKRLIRGDGLSIVALLDAVLPWFPLDRYVEQPVALMQLAPPDTVRPARWDDYRAILDEHHIGPLQINLLDRDIFYQRSLNAFAIVATGDSAMYGNILLKKGVVE